MNFKTLSDEQLTELIRDNDCSDSIVELTSRHKALVTQISKKYANAAHCSGIALGDFLEEAEFLVFDAAKKFNADKETKFSTWLGNRVRYHCLNTLNKQAKYYSPNQENFTEHIAEQAVNEQEQEKNFLESQLEYITNLLSQVKDPRVQTIIRMRYLNGTSKHGDFRSIAKHLNMSTQGIINLHDSFIKFVREKVRADENMDRI